MTRAELQKIMDAPGFGTGRAFIEQKAQGYRGLALRDTVTEDGTPVMCSAWEPTPDEIALIAAGEPIYLWVWGTGHPPVMLTVGEVT